MSLRMSSRRNDIDAIKGLAIIFVVLYHMGIMESGYLGVDVFFVLGGFFIVSSVTKQICSHEFRYFKFIIQRVIRLLPALLTASAVCLIIGFVFYLPDDYENVAESIVASIFFSNNILSAITTKNYWNTVNEFKPLMHTWYLGILMEFYIIVPLIIMALKKISEVFKTDVCRTIQGGGTVIVIFSFAAFLLPVASANAKFYYLPFRLYELLLGGIIGLYNGKAGKCLRNKYISWLSFFGLVATNCIGLLSLDFESIGSQTVIIGADSNLDAGLLLPNNILVFLTVLFTSLYLTAGKNDVLCKSRILSEIGVRSYSIFLWHQVILAMYRYLITSKISITFIACFMVLLCIVSEVSFRLIEPVKAAKLPVFATAASAVVIVGLSGMIYLHAGVVRDVPELDIEFNNVHRNMHAKYCDRIHQYEDDFADDSKWMVLIIGNSFARDMGNIILESQYADNIELSYTPYFKEELIERIQRADRILIFAAMDKVPDYLWENAKSQDIIYGIGTKNFGVSNGNIYSRRFMDGYFNLTATCDFGYYQLNEQWKSEWGDNYIDMMASVMTEEGRIKVFTDDNRYISQDCSHLTKAGAEYYARILNLEKVLFE